MLLEKKVRIGANCCREVTGDSGLVGTYLMARLHRLSSLIRAAFPLRSRK